MEKRTERVTPLAGVWIETFNFWYTVAAAPSLPLRECGLKQKPFIICIKVKIVTPLAGVWIETCPDPWRINRHCVTPLAGVWIETSCSPSFSCSRLVTPLAGVWIETPAVLSELFQDFRHSPCGSVD